MAYERIKCPKCDKDFGQEFKFAEHIFVVHGISDINQFYVDLNCSGEWPTCQCSQDCKVPLKLISWKKGFLSKYARGHNARVDSVYLNPERQREFADKRSQGYEQGKYQVWNAGLTKETSDKIAHMSAKISKTLNEGYSTGRLKDWHALDPEKSLLVAQKISIQKKKLYSEGLLEPWNKGKTKYDDSRVAAMSFGIKENYEENPDASSKRLSSRELIERVDAVASFKLKSDPESYKNKYQKLQFECLKCGAIQLKNLMMLENSPVCFSCAPRESKAQLEIYEFVKSLSGDAVLSDRTVISPKELDVWVPSVKLGIEYNGLFWHAEPNLSDSFYHQNKHDLCVQSGVKLLSIYEDEWRDKRVLIEGMIRHRLNRPIRIWDARKLSVVELDQKSARDFFESNHLEGHVRSVVTFALKDDVSGLVLAAMSLRRPFHRKYVDFLEAGRCCTLVGHSVRGWLGRLTKVCKNYAKINGNNGLMTYVDLRVGTGIGYESAGWKLVNRDTSPRFWWTNYRNRFNRFKYRADKSRNLSQSEVALESGVVPIWGCSNSMFVFDVC